MNRSIPTYRTPSKAALVLLAALASANLANAAALTWDGNTTTTGAQDGNGTWTTGAAGWWNGSTNVNWTALDTATIGAGTDAGTKTITLGGNITTGLANGSNGGIHFASSGYTLTANSATTITLGNATSSSGGNVTIASGKSATIGTNVRITGYDLSGGSSVVNIFGGGTLNIVGTGAEVRTGSNNFSIFGGTTVNVGIGGKLNAANSQLIIGTNAGNATVVVDGGSVLADTVASGAQNFVLANNNTAGSTVSGTLTINSGLVSNPKTSGGLRFGSSTNNTGATAFSNSTLNLNGGILEVGYLFAGTAGNVTRTATVNLNGGTLKVLAGSTNAGNATTTFMAGLTSANVLSGGARFDTNGVDTIVAQPLLDAGGGGGLTKLGNGTLTLTGSNTYSGTTDIQVGTLSLGRAGGTLLDTAAVNVNGGTLNVANADTVGAVTLTSGTISGAAALTGTSYTLKSGTVSAQLAGSGVGLTKNTSGTVTLAGTQSYTGATNIDAGTLNITGSLASAVNVNAGGALGGEGSTSSSLAFGAGSASFNYDPATGTAFTAGSVSVNGTAFVLLSPTGSTTTGTPYLVLTNTAGFAGGVIPTNFAPAARGTLSLANSNKDLTFTPTAAATLKWTGANGTNPTFWDAVNTVNWTNGGSSDRFYTNDNVTFDDTASSFVVAVQGGSINPGSVVFDNSSNAYTLNGVIGGGGTLTKNGSNTATLTGANTYSGGTTVNAGTLRATTSASALGSGALTLAGGELQLANDTGLNFGSNTTVSGNAKITSDTLTSAAGVTQTLGTLSIGNNTLTIAGGANATGSTARVAFGTTSLTGAATFSIGANSTLSLGAVANGANTATLSGAGNFVQTGVWGGGSGGVTLGSGFTGTATINQANTYTGATTIRGGTFQITNYTDTTTSGALGAAPSSPTAANIVLDGGTLEAFSATGTNSFTLNSNRGIALGTAGGTLKNSLANNFTYNGVIADQGGSAGGLTIAASGQTILGGQSTYTGGTSITGFLAIAADSVGSPGSLTSGPVGVGTLNLAGGNLRATNAASRTLGNALIISGNSTFTSGGAVDKSLTFTGSATLSGGNRTITVNTVINNGGADGFITFSGAIGDAANNLGLTKAGAGTLVLSGTNTYTGGTTVNSGTLSLSHASDTLADTGAVTVTGGTLAIGANSDTVGVVTLTGGSITGSTGILTGSAYNVQSGTISAILGGSAALTKSTGGTVTLSGVNTYTGDTTINGGTLQVNGSLGATAIILNAGSLKVGAAGSISSSTISINGGSFDATALVGGYTVSSGQTIKGTGTYDGKVTVGSGATLAPGNSPGVVTFSGDLTLSGTTVIEIDGTTRGTQYDGIDLTGNAANTLAYGGTLTLTFGTPITAGTYDLFSIGTVVQGGDFTSVGATSNAVVSSLSSLIINSGTGWTANLADTASNTWLLSFDNASGDLTVTAIPEPSTYAILAGFATLGLSAGRRRRHQKNAA